MYNQKDASLNKYLKKAKEFTDENEPIYKECPNKGNPCFCPGTCREVIGYRKKISGSIFKMPE